MYGIIQPTATKHNNHPAQHCTHCLEKTPQRHPHKIYQTGMPSILSARHVHIVCCLPPLRQAVGTCTATRCCSSDTYKHNFSPWQVVTLVTFAPCSKSCDDEGTAGARLFLYVLTRLGGNEPNTVYKWLPTLQIPLLSIICSCSVGEGNKEVLAFLESAFPIGTCLIVLHKG
jgi:hypothetical protein